jgi:hypothetical protein
MSFEDVTNNYLNNDDAELNTTFFTITPVHPKDFKALDLESIYSDKNTVMKDHIYDIYKTSKQRDILKANYDKKTVLMSAKSLSYLMGEDNFVSIRLLSLFSMSALIFPFC